MSNLKNSVLMNTRIMSISQNINMFKNLLWKFLLIIFKPVLCQGDQDSTEFDEKKTKKRIYFADQRPDCFAIQEVSWCFQWCLPRCHYRRWKALQLSSYNHFQLVQCPAAIQYTLHHLTLFEIKTKIKNDQVKCN